MSQQVIQQFSWKLFEFISFEMDDRLIYQHQFYKMVRMIDDYVLNEVLGQGSYGKVYKATNTKKEGSQFAVKVVPIEKFKEKPKLEECTTNQIKTLTTIQLSEHIVKYIQMLKTKNNFYFVYQFCNGGTLQDMIKRQSTIPQKKSLIIFEEILEAFKVLNKYSIMHRDIKPQNIFFHNNVAKLGDFGFCKQLKPQQNMTKTMLGSPIYMAPEVLKGQTYTTKADIWSLGVILYEMLYGICPYQSNSIAMLINTISSSDITFPTYPTVSQNTKTLIKRMLAKDYFRRIGWVQLFNQFNITQGTIPYNPTDSITFGSSADIYTSTDLSYDNEKKYSLSPSKSRQFKSNNLGLTPQFQTPSKNYDDSNRKVTSVPKQRIENKRFQYSQKYKTILNLPLRKTVGAPQDNNNFNAKANQQAFDQKKEDDNDSYNYTQKRSPLVPLKEKNKNEGQRRNSLLKKHEQCLKALKRCIELLQTRQKGSVSQSFLVLRKIQQKLKQITSQIKVTDFQLLDISSLVNYEVIQVDRLIIETKQQMLKMDMQIPEPDNYSQLSDSSLRQFINGDY